jgi:hypothetical protein
LQEEEKMKNFQNKSIDTASKHRRAAVRRIRVKRNSLPKPPSNERRKKFSEMRPTDILVDYLPEGTILRPTSVTALIAPSHTEKRTSYGKGTGGIDLMKILAGISIEAGIKKEVLVDESAVFVIGYQLIYLEEKEMEQEKSKKE